MQYLIRRLIDRGIIARRNDAAWLRRALCDRYEVSGQIREVDADTIVDPEQHFPFNVYGRFDGEGHHEDGERLAIVTGAAAGKSWELLDSTGSRFRVVGAVDLAAEGVAVGDSYEVHRRQEDRAIEWFGKMAIRTIIGFPQTAGVAPCYAVTFEASDEQGRPVGNTGRYVTRSGSPEGPIVRDLRSTWQERYSVQCHAVTPDACDWMAEVLLYLYRNSIRMFDRAFDSDVTAQMSGLTFIDTYKTFMREVTIGGRVELSTKEEVAWHKDESVGVTVGAKRVDLRR